MNRTFRTLAVAAVLAGAGLAGCGGSGGAESPSSTQVTAALRRSAGELDPENPTSTETECAARVPRLVALLDELRAVPQLAPLFDLYAVPDPLVADDDVRAAGLVQLLRAVQITIASGTVTIVNRDTGDVIFSAPLSNLASGVFHPENLPGGPPPPATCTYTYSAWSACLAGVQTRTVTSSTPAGCTGIPALTQACTTTTPPPPPTVTTCTSFTYSAWGACQPDGTQTRTVLGSSPSGCTGGTPATTQACTYAAPLDGAALYGTYCARCHGSLATSNLKGKNISVSSVKSWNMTQGLTDPQLQAIVTAVGP